MTALALRAMDRPRDALKCVLRVLKINPDNSQAASLKGELQEAIKSRPQAPAAVSREPSAGGREPPRIVAPPAPAPIPPPSDIEVQDVETVNMD
jgi:hypothetical protein